MPANSPPSQLIGEIDPRPNSENVFNVRRLGEGSPYYVGRSPGGYCTLLIRVRGGARTVPLLLAGIQALFSVQCRIREENAAGTVDEFTLVCCSSSDVRTESYFLNILDIIVQRLGNLPDPHAVEDTLLQLVALFQRLQAPPTRTVVGLVGELLLIDMASSPDRAVDAWRSENSDRFDFSIGTLRVDCKATSSRTHAHEFSLEQTHPPAGARAFVMSVSVESAGGGQSLSRLLDSIEQKLTGVGRVMRLREVVAESLGSGLLEALEWKFDRELALSSAGLYEMADIPRLTEQPPAGVTRVRFVSDLSLAPRTNGGTVLLLPDNAGEILPKAASVYA